MTRSAPPPAGPTHGLAADSLDHRLAGAWRRAGLPPLLVLTLMACSGIPDPAVAPSSPTFVAPRPAAPAPSALPGRGKVFAAPPPSQGVREQAALASACRQDADRIVVTRDRGQLMRDDERDARVGTESSIYARRTETDRLGRIFERDRIAADCVQQNTRSAPRR